MPELREFIAFEPPTIGRMYDSNGNVVIELAKEYRRIISYKDIAGLPIEQALLSAEDKDFFQHNGISLSGIVRAAIKNYKAGTTKQGASTFNQQIGRLYVPEIQELKRKENGVELQWNNFLSRFMTHWVKPQTINKYYRKVQEAKTAIWIEKVMTRHYGSKQKAKEEIFARWASFVYLSNGQYGVSAGAEYYFGKQIKELSYSESALLAGIVKSPNNYAPKSTEVRTSHYIRRNAVLDLMALNGHITRSEALKYGAEKIQRPVGREDMRVNASAPVDHAFRELQKKGYSRVQDEIYEGRTEVYLTINQGIQKIANEALERGLIAYEKRHPNAKGLTQGSVIVLRNHDGAILAEVGGRQMYRGKRSEFTDFNRVILARRQPGSAFKPFIYLSAFENGMDLSTLVQDRPIKVNMGRGQPAKVIKNYDKKYKGTIPLVQAISESRNAATIWIARQIIRQNKGRIGKLFTPARLIGIESGIEPYITTSLGATDVTLLELANAYRTLASGLYAEPYIIERIIWEPKDSFRIFQPDTHMPQVSLQSITLIQTCLRSIVRLPSGTAHALDASDFPIQVAGKTGTTTAFKDSLFAGFTYGVNGITVVVRVGFDNPGIGYDEGGNFGSGPGRGLGEKETGARTALPIFKEIMLRVYADALIGPPPHFPEEIENAVTAWREVLTAKANK